MSRYSAGEAAGATIVGTAARPIAGLLMTATVSGVLREVHLFNETVTACTYGLYNFTGGTAGTDVTERKHRRNAPASSCQAKNGWTADATIGEFTGYAFELGAAIGSGGIFTFGDEGLEGELGATSGLGIVLIAGAPASGPRWCLVWDE